MKTETVSIEAIGALVFVRCFALLLAASGASAFAAPGDFDATFGGGDGQVRPTNLGQVTLRQSSSITGEVSGQPAIVLQPDGKLVAVASCKTGATFDLCVARFNADGSSDTTFSGNGIVVIDMRSSNDYVAGVVLQPDGKIVVSGTCAAPIVGTTGDDFCLLRLSGDGVLDTSFSGDGKVITPMTNFNDTATSMSLQADGKIVVAGFCGSATAVINACVARYTAAGTLDTNFSSDGIAIVRPNIDFATVTRRANSVAIAAEGKIVLVGSVDDGTASSKTNIQVIRLLDNGTPDTSFAGDGFFTVSSTTETSAANDVTIQPDELIVVASSVLVNSSGTGRMTVHRLTTAGTLDTTFGSSGQVRIPMITTPLDDGSITERAYSIASQSDGKIVVAGECSASYVSLGFFRQACIARLHDSGSLDTGIFAGTGSYAFNFAGAADPSGFGVAIQSDGKIALVARCGDLCIARFEGGPFGARNCSLDIDGDGKVLVTTDMLIGTRVALGMTGSAVINGITFAAHAVRDEWGTNTSRDIRKHLITQCGMSIAP
jgi:uncharacterized delta-60 repeat protein